MNNKKSGLIPINGDGFVGGNHIAGTIFYPGAKISTGQIGVESELVARDTTQFYLRSYLHEAYYFVHRSDQKCPLDQICLNQNMSLTLRAKENG